MVYAKRKDTSPYGTIFPGANTFLTRRNSTRKDSFFQKGEKSKKKKKNVNSHFVNIPVFFNAIFHGPITAFLR